MKAKPAKKKITRAAKQKAKQSKSGKTAVKTSPAKTGKRAESAAKKPKAAKTTGAAAKKTAGAKASKAVAGKPGRKRPAKTVAAKSKKPTGKVSRPKGQAKPKKTSKVTTSKSRVSSKKKKAGALTAKKPGAKKISAQKTAARKKKTAKKPSGKTSAPKTRAAVKKVATKKTVRPSAKKKPSVKAKAVKTMVKQSIIWTAPPESVETKTEKTSLKIFLPEEHGEIALAEIPGEFGENEVLLMAVDPNTVFVSWEITDEAFLKGEGTFCLRAYDVTGVDSDSGIYNSFIDLRIDKRVGNEFFNLGMQGREVIVEIGFIGADRKFRPIRKSNRVAIPALLVPDELGIAQKLFESGIPLGY